MNKLALVMIIIVVALLGIYLYLNRGGYTAVPHGPTSPPHVNGPTQPPPGTVK